MFRLATFTLPPTNPATMSTAGSLLNNVDVLGQLFSHGLKRNILGGPGRAVQATRILLREEALGTIT